MVSLGLGVVVKGEQINLHICLTYKLSNEMQMTQLVFCARINAVTLPNTKLLI